MLTFTISPDCNSDYFIEVPEGLDLPALQALVQERGYPETWTPLIAAQLGLVRE